MDKKWLFKYRIEFPIFICVLTTFIYTFDTSIFLYYRPTISLLISMFIVGIGIGTHIWLSRISEADGFHLNVYTIQKHTKHIGDYFIWLGAAFFSGSVLTILIYSIAYILFYGIKIKRKDYNINKLSTRKIFSRDVSNTILLMMSISYISALKNYLITKSFTPLFYVKVLFAVCILAFIVMIVLAPNKKESTGSEDTENNNTTIDNAEQDIATDGIEDNKIVKEDFSDEQQ